MQGTNGVGLSCPGGYAERLREVCRGFVGGNAMICSCRWLAKRLRLGYRLAEDKFEGDTASSQC
jgi:hypothetical protein